MTAAELERELKAYREKHPLVDDGVSFIAGIDDGSYPI